MKRQTLLGIVLVIATSLCFVGKATNESKNAKPPKSSIDLVLSETTIMSDALAASFVYDMEAGVILDLNINMVASPYSIAPVGTPNTKFRSQPYFHPLKLC